MARYHFIYTTGAGKVHHVELLAVDFQLALDKLYAHCPIAQIIDWGYLEC